MIKPDAAWAAITEYVRPLGIIPTRLENAGGLCLAEDIRADRDIPPSNRSAMDGFAVRAADLAKTPASLKLTGEVAAGSPARPEVKPGACVRILTGANVPPGADTVVMVEYTRERNGIVEFSGPVRKGSNIMLRGEDAHNRSLLIPKLTALGAMQIATCATVGKAVVKVYRRPRIVIICTGTELRETGARVAPHEMRNSNGPALSAALAEWGFHNTQVNIIPDSRTGLRNFLRKVLVNHDVVILTGGMSVGKYDFAKATLENIGADIIFHGVAMKPGKPVLYAVKGKQRHVFGLPGNPLSAMTGFHEFVLPALRRLSGLPEKACRPLLHLALTDKLMSKGGRTRFVLGRIEWEKSGPAVRAIKSQSSADVVAAAGADGVIIVPPETTTLGRKEIVQFRPWRVLP